MSDIITECSGNILRIQLNRPERKNAMTSAMYITLADLFNDAAKDDEVRVVLWHGAGDSFSAGNDIQDFLKNPPGAGESPQARLIQALIDFDKPIVAAVHGAAIGGGTTMLTHCDFVFAGESAKFQMPFVRNQEFSERVRSAEAKEAFSAFLEKRKPNFSAISQPKTRSLTNSEMSIFERLIKK